MAVFNETLPAIRRVEEPESFTSKAERSWGGGFKRPHAFQRIFGEDETNLTFIDIMVVNGSSCEPDFEVNRLVAEGVGSYALEGPELSVDVGRVS